ncbi:hypothetical protein BD626DRAFT_533246 [Schizophyllum amplum]|uniref:Uncharacterized protein n=1 Tax=Schizophyllum amplum TaxID=97359 RepID=A0A550CXZ4_9AGAR|nr:hypothetical protein BD626DRAFT_533246 [Auriculariopsis ampla]
MSSSSSRALGQAAAAGQQGSSAWPQLEAKSADEWADDERDNVDMDATKGAQPGRFLSPGPSSSLEPSSSTSPGRSRPPEPSSFPGRSARTHSAVGGRRAPARLMRVGMVDGRLQPVEETVRDAGQAEGWAAGQTERRAAGQAKGRTAEQPASGGAEAGKSSVTLECITAKQIAVKRLSAEETLVEEDQTSVEG